MYYRECYHCGLDLDYMAHDLRYIGFINGKDEFAHWQCIEKEENLMRQFLSVEKMREFSGYGFYLLDLPLHDFSVFSRTSKFTNLATGLVIDSNGNYYVQPQYLNKFAESSHESFVKYAEQNCLEDFEDDEPVTHLLKTVQPHFNAVWTNSKNAELRQNDRQYRLCDQLLLVEFDLPTRVYSDRWVLGQITYIFEETEPVQLQPGHIMMCFEEVYSSEQKGYDETPDL